MRFSKITLISFLIIINSTLILANEDLLSRKILIQNYKYFLESKDAYNLWKKFEKGWKDVDGLEIKKNLIFLSACEFALQRHLKQGVQFEFPITIKIEDTAIGHEKTNTFASEICTANYLISKAEFLELDISLFTGDVEKLNDTAKSMDYTIRELVDLAKFKSVIKNLQSQKMENFNYQITQSILGDEYIKIGYLVMFFKLNILSGIEKEIIEKNISRYLEEVYFKDGRLSSI